MLTLIFAKKLDNRKCLLLGQLRERRRIKRAELLEAEAAAAGLTARQLWEAQNVPGANGADGVSGGGGGRMDGLKKKYFGDEEDEEERLQREVSKNDV